MESVQPSTLAGEFSSSEHLSRRHSSTSFAPSLSQLPIGSESDASTQWVVGNTLPPLLQSTRSPTRADASSSRVYLPPLDTHQYQQVQPERESFTLTQHYPNKRRRLSGTLPPQSHPYQLGFADSPGPRGQSDRPGKPTIPLQPCCYELLLITMLSDLAASHPATLPPPFGRQEWSQSANADLTRAEDHCCRNGCQGPKCSIVRRVVRELFAEIDARVPASGGTPDTESHRIREVCHYRIMSRRWSSLDTFSHASALKHY